MASGRDGLAEYIAADESPEGMCNDSPLCGVRVAS